MLVADLRSVIRKLKFKDQILRNTCKTEAIFSAALVLVACPWICCKIRTTCCCCSGVKLFKSIYSEFDK